MMVENSERLLKRAEVEDLVGIGKNTLYRLIAAGEFPRQLAVGPRARRWRLSEVREWLESRPRGGTDS